jgi:hypothetical protein
VVVRLGICHFDFETDAGKIVCPICTEKCKRGADDTVLLTGCSWKFEGVLCDGEKRAAEGHAPSDAFYQMEKRGEKGTTDVMWKSLVIISSPS